MKKFLIIALSAVFVLGLAASAFAIHAEIPSETQAVVAKGETQITLGGSIRIRAEYLDTREYDDTDEWTDRSFYDQRVRLWVDAKVSDDVQGFIMLESEEDSSRDSWVWGRDSDNAVGVYPEGNSKKEASA